MHTVNSRKVGGLRAIVARSTTEAITKQMFWPKVAWFTLRKETPNHKVNNLGSTLVSRKGKAMYIGIKHTSD